MRKNPKRTLTIAIIVIIALSLLVYGFFKVKAIIQGPKIIVTSVYDGQSFTEPFIEIKGQAKNTSFITLNDRSILIDEKGNFNEKLLLLPGYTIIELYAEDRFEKKDTVLLRVFLKSTPKAQEITGTN